MKKFTALLLALILVISLVSCSAKSEEKQTEAEEGEKEITEKAETENEESDTEADTTEPQTGILHEDPNEAAGEESEILEYQPLLYKITDSNGSCVWLFGSIHVGNESMIPMPDYVMDAYNSADALAVECDILAAEDDISIDAVMDMMYSDGTTIADYISPEIYEKAVEILENSSYGYSPTYDYMKPVVWWELIVYSLYDELGLTEDYGIDTNLLQMAKDEGKEIKEVESVEFQLELQMNFDHELQVLMLESVVEGMSEENRDDSEKEISDLYIGWYTGNEELIIGDTESDYEGLTDEEIALLEEYNDQMLYDRNIGMADFTLEALENDENIFICVGAAHVVGEGGIIDLLDDQGFTIEIIK